MLKGAWSRNVDLILKSIEKQGNKKIWFKHGCVWLGQLARTGIRKSSLLAMITMCWVIGLRFLENPLWRRDCPNHDISPACLPRAWKLSPSIFQDKQHALWWHGEVCPSGSGLLPPENISVWYEALQLDPPPVSDHQAAGSELWFGSYPRAAPCLRHGSIVTMLIKCCLGPECWG